MIFAVTTIYYFWIKYLLTIDFLPLNTALLGILFYALFQTSTVGANLWLSVWSEDPEAATDVSKRNLYLGVYAALGFFQVIFSSG